MGDLLSRTGTHRVAALSQSGQEAQDYSSSTILGQFNSIINFANRPITRLLSRRGSIAFLPKHQVDHILF